MLQQRPKMICASVYLASFGRDFWTSALRVLVVSAWVLMHSKKDLEIKQINKSYGLWFRISFSKFKQKGCPHIHSACLTKLHSQYAVKPPTFLLKVVLLKALDSILAKSCSAVRGYQSGIHSCAEVKQLTLFGHAAHVQIHMSKS